MADEEKQDQTTETEAEQATEQPTPEAEAGATPEAEAAEAAAGDGAADGSSGGGDDLSGLTDKQRNRLLRSRLPHEARPQRSPEERKAERVKAREAKARARRRRRQAAKSKRADRPAGTGTPAAVRDANGAQGRQGVVVSDKGDKTITVRVDFVHRHPVYEKIVRRSRTLRAHDEKNRAGQGDTVRVVETRPYSKTKHWRLVEILEKAR